MGDNRPLKSSVLTSACVLVDSRDVASYVSTTIFITLVI